MFVEQTKVILQLQPLAVCLEISDNAINVNDGAEIAEVTVALEVAYVVYAKTIMVWKHGDPSNRTRLFMVALHKDLGQAAHDFRWPTESFDESRVPMAKLIAVADEDVPEKYWRYDQVTEFEKWENENKAHKIQVVARTGTGMGPAWRPPSVQSWQGLLNGPTTLGGGGRPTAFSDTPRIRTSREPSLRLRVRVIVAGKVRGKERDLARARAPKLAKAKGAPRKTKSA